MGGTTFQWVVAPYGLKRNPAGYSRGMMYALKGLDHCALDGDRAHASSCLPDPELELAMHWNGNRYKCYGNRNLVKLTDMLRSNALNWNGNHANKLRQNDGE